MAHDAPKSTSVLNSSVWTAVEFRVGTLSYTRSALLTVMFWMLWADLCLQIMESLPSIIPLQLKALGASNTLIGFVKDSLQAIVTVAVVPIIGMQSDRHRGPMGRRRPFLLWMTIPVCLSLVLLGFADPIAKRVQAILGGAIGSDYRGLAIVLIGVFAGSFFLFNLYVLQIYGYLIADVIPTRTMGLFVGLFRAVGALAAFVFNRWIFAYGETHPHWVYSGCGILYATAFLLLVWRVREGQYPPPQEAGERTGVVRFMVKYARECYTNPFYLKLYFFSLFYWTAYVPFATFIVFFATKTKEGYAPSLGLSVESFGQIRGWTTLPMVLVFLALGPLVDRFHPLRILIAGIGLLAGTFLAGFWCVYTPNQLLAWWVCNAVASAVVGLGYLSMAPALFPREKYGQYSSANQFFFCLGLMVTPTICGGLMDLIKDYRYLFLWSGISAAISTGFAVSVYRHWKRLGGDDAFVPPVATPQFVEADD